MQCFFFNWRLCGCDRPANSGQEECLYTASMLDSKPGVSNDA